MNQNPKAWLDRHHPEVDKKRDEANLQTLEKAKIQDVARLVRNRRCSVWARSITVLYDQMDCKRPKVTVTNAGSLQ